MTLPVVCGKVTIMRILPSGKLKITYARGKQMRGKRRLTYRKPQKKRQRSPQKGLGALAINK